MLVSWFRVAGLWLAQSLEKLRCDASGFFIVENEYFTTRANAPWVLVFQLSTICLILPLHCYFVFSIKIALSLGTNLQFLHCMKNLVPEDDQLKIMLAGTVEQCKMALHHLFADPALRTQVIAYIRKHGGTQEDGEDAMQEAVVIFDKNFRAGRFKGDGTLRGYFFGIVKWWWYSRNRSHKPMLDFNPDIYDAEVESHEDLLIADERINAIREALQEIGERCQQILTLWGQNVSMEKIAEAIGLRDRIAAKREAYRCRERFTNIIKSNPRLRAQVGL